MKQQVKKRFWILNKVYKKLLPADRKQIDFMFDVIRREMDLMLRKSAEKRKGK